MVTSNFWQLISRDTHGERTTEVFSAIFPQGTLIKNVTTFFDHNARIVKVVSESMAFAPNSSGGGGGGSGPIGNAFSAFNDVTGVMPGVLTSVLMFTAPSGGTSYLYRVEMAGTLAAQFTIYVNGVLVDTKYTSIAGPFDVLSEFSAGNSAGIPLSTGDTVEVKVIHSRDVTGDFNARVHYVLVS